MRAITNRLRARRDSGLSLPGTLVGIGVGAVILTGVMYFWVSQNTASTVSSKHQEAQASLVTLANRVVRDIQVADPLVYGDGDEVIVATVDDDGARTLTRYAIEDGAATQQLWLDAPETYTSATDGNRWNSIDKGAVAGRVADDQAFRFFATDGSEITALPVTSQAGADEVVRVDLDLSADVSDTGEVAIKTSAALRNKQAEGDVVAATAPACPPFTISAPAAGAAPTLTWGGITAAEKYLVTRDGAEVAVITRNGSQSEYTFTDSTLGQVDRPITYRVLAENASGVVSTACQPVVWSPPAARPTVSANVLPAAVTDPSAWESTAATAPSMVLNWAKVDGATGYSIMRREVDTTAYAPLAGAAGQWVEAQRINDANIVTHTFTNPGYARAYEFYVTATSRTGNSLASNYIKLLSHPAPAKVDAPVPTSYNKNVVNWASVPTASSYEVWRYPIDQAPPTSTATASADAERISTTNSKPVIHTALASTNGANATTVAAAGMKGSPTRVGVVTADKTSFTDTADLGSRYYYFVAAVNTGPRDQTGSAIARYSSTPASATAVKPVTDSALQFPPDPVRITATGSEANAIGTNKITWTPTKSAVSYKIQKAWTRGSTLLINRNLGSALSFTDTGVPRGTLHDYWAVAVNATGVSPNGAGVSTPVRASAAQLPDAPGQNLTVKPTLSSNNWRVDWAATTDKNPAANKFCNSSICTYRVYESRSGSWVQLTATQALAYAASQNWGDSRILAVSACNPGGCSPLNAWTQADSYPGPFVTSSEQTIRSAWTTNSRNGNNQSDVVGQSMYFTWSGAAGAWGYALQGPGSTGWTSGLNGAAFGPQQGTVYNYAVVARAANGLERSSGTQAAQSAPGTPRETNITGRCGANQFQTHFFGNFAPLEGGSSFTVVDHYWQSGINQASNDVRRYHWGTGGFDVNSEIVRPNQAGGIGYSVHNYLAPGAGVGGKWDSDTMNSIYFLEGRQGACTGNWREPTPGPYFTADGGSTIYNRSY